MSREVQMTKWWLPRWLARAILPELSTASSRHWLQSPRTSSWGLGRLTTFCALFRSALQYDFLITARITELILGGGVCKVGCAFPGIMFWRFVKRGCTTVPVEGKHTHGTATVQLSEAYESRCMCPLGHEPGQRQA